MLGRIIQRSKTAVIMADANLIRPPNTPLRLLQAGNRAIARMVPHITGEIKGLKILKHRAIKRAITPIRIAISIAGPVYAFSRVILSGSFIRILPSMKGCDIIEAGTRFEGLPSRDFFEYHIVFAISRLIWPQKGTKITKIKFQGWV